MLHQQKADVITLTGKTLICVVAPLYYDYAGKLLLLSIQQLRKLQSVNQGSTSAGCERLRERLLG